MDRDSQSNEVNVNVFNPNFGWTVLFYRNGLTLDYNALQLQFQRRLSRGLQSLASYTWSHSIDYGSFDSSLPYQRGNSNTDVRHAFSGAFSYDFPNPYENLFGRTVLHGWGFDKSVHQPGPRFPIILNGGNPIVDPATGHYFYAGSGS